MGNLIAKLLGIPAIAVATMFPAGCPMLPEYPHGIVNINFSNAPYDYRVDITAWDGNLNHVNAIVGTLNAGKKNTSFQLYPNTYSINAYGNDNMGKAHGSIENEILTVKDNETYNLSLTMN